MADHRRTTHARTRNRASDTPTPSSAEAPVPAPAQAAGPTTFAALGVPAALTRVLAADGITTPFPIQTATLPDSLAGRDVLGRGRTGSGKTLAFALPVVARLAASGAPLR
jgi:superfamily II DNA/RNA helicase